MINTGHDNPERSSAVKHLIVVSVIAEAQLMSNILCSHYRNRNYEYFNHINWYTCLISYVIFYQMLACILHVKFQKLHIQNPLLPLDSRPVYILVSTYHKAI